MNNNKCVGNNKQIFNYTQKNKNEYQRRVSPIVRNGGRSNEIHINKIKLKKANSPNTVVV